MNPLDVLGSGCVVGEQNGKDWTAAEGGGIVGVWKGGQGQRRVKMNLRSRKQAAVAQFFRGENDKMPTFDIRGMGDGKW